MAPARAASNFSVFPGGGLAGGLPLDAPDQPDAGAADSPFAGLYGWARDPISNASGGREASAPGHDLSDVQPAGSGAGEFVKRQDVCCNAV
jgi:hypothetical protein